MTHADFEMLALSDPRLAVHAAGALPAWLWSSDGSRVLWANAIGARALGATNVPALVTRTFGPADSHRRQIAQLGRRLPETGALRLERLRGFGAPLGTLATCGCARIDLPDGTHGVLIASSDTGGRSLPLAERLKRLVEPSEHAMIAFTQDGQFTGISTAGRRLFGMHDLSDACFTAARGAALADGIAEVTLGTERAALHRIGSGNQTALVAVPLPALSDEADAPGPASITDEALAADAPAASPLPMDLLPADGAEPPPAPSMDDMTERETNYEAPALSNEAPTKVLLIDDPAEAELFEPLDRAPQVAGDLPPCAPSPIEAASWAADEAAPPIPDAPDAQTKIAADDASTPGRRHPLRFSWQIDAEGRFSLGSDEFARLIGPESAGHLGQPWPEIASSLGVDPEGRVSAAIATRETWSNLVVIWPAAAGERLAVELSGLPVFTADKVYSGYRGFGVCRDIDALNRLDAVRRSDAGPSDAPDADDIDDAPPDFVASRPAQSDHAPAADVPPPQYIVAAPSRDASIAAEAPHIDGVGLEAAGNVVPFRAPGESKLPALTPVENNAFHELARQLSARLEGEIRNPAELAGPTLEPAARVSDPFGPPHQDASGMTDVAGAQGNGLQTDWLAPEVPPAHGDSQRDRILLDLLPTGMLIYRLDRLLYANPAFFKQMGYADLPTLEQAGGLDALYVEPGAPSGTSRPEAGTPVTISAADGSTSEEIKAEARLFTITWDGDTAHALIFAPAPGPAAALPATVETPPVQAPAPSATPLVVAPPPSAGHAEAEDLAAILDVTAEGILMFDAGGNIHACNRSAEALFGYDGVELARRNLIELFAPESARLVLDYLDSVQQAGASGALDQGREVLGKIAQGGAIPLSITIGRTRADGPNFFAVFRDLSQLRRGESELLHARRVADRAANAKADMLARISQEVRAPLNAIIGFAEVMIGERFGTLGNARYAEYMKDIRASGERVVSLIDDLLELSRIETGKLELAFTAQNLNELVESCVAVMQPQANRARIIIRTSLSQALPPVIADTRALRQIATNLISASISLANAGGQVIVSTAMSDFGEVVLRVRDTGHALNDQAVAAALEPFRATAGAEFGADGSGLSLSLTKALVEANRAQFHIKAAPKSGTLMEVVFSRAVARNQSTG
ncbi:Two-component hybrid sensor and regulator [Bradyrhizobium sp. ORS 278]|uniref:PAS domain-containing sensor histidine kinase n=1 Tax=Bradyrhizobium sp. (strain ORS 278) TaxID=114615 RepID=UPI0001507BF0|nr:PAS domain-containing sensor histidine kinase [Bradyrhizobium sp. ORS 278]CAL75139.1 Two-component hybrid sensor and regulator [Bradyrhizobium sp. ORS 278]